MPVTKEAEIILKEGALPHSPPKEMNIVEAMVFDEKGRVLLLKRSKKNTFFVGKWQLPGGKVNPKEPIRKAIIRELKEETACSCFSLKKIKYFFFEWRFNGFDQKVSLTVFSCKLKGKLSVCSDHSEMKFFDLKKIKKSSLTPISKKAIFD